MNHPKPLVFHHSSSSQVSCHNCVLSNEQPGNHQHCKLVLQLITQCFCTAQQHFTDQQLKWLSQTHITTKHNPNVFYHHHRSIVRLSQCSAAPVHTSEYCLKWSFQKWVHEKLHLWFTVGVLNQDEPVCDMTASWGDSDTHTHTHTHTQKKLNYLVTSWRNNSTARSI